MATNPVIFCLARSAQTKLSRATGTGNLDLRKVVGHANFLDRLVQELYDRGYDWNFNGDDPYVEYIEDVVQGGGNELPFLDNAANSDGYEFGKSVGESEIEVEILDLSRLAMEDHSHFCGQNSTNFALPSRASQVQFQPAKPIRESQKPAAPPPTPQRRPPTPPPIREGRNAKNKKPQLLSESSSKGPIEILWALLRNQRIVTQNCQAGRDHIGRGGRTE